MKERLSRSLGPGRSSKKIKRSWLFWISSLLARHLRPSETAFFLKQFSFQGLWNISCLFFIRYNVYFASAISTQNLGGSDDTALQSFFTPHSSSSFIYFVGCWRGGAANDG
jgi:hypothetical protein